MYVPLTSWNQAGVPGEDRTVTIIVGVGATVVATVGTTVGVAISGAPVAVEGVAVGAIGVVNGAGVGAIGVVNGAGVGAYVPLLERCTAE